MSIPISNSGQPRKESIGEEVVKGRRNKAYYLIKQELAEKEKIKRKTLKLNKGKKSKNPMDQVTQDLNISEILFICV